MSELSIVKWSSVMTNDFSGHNTFNEIHLKRIFKKKKNKFSFPFYEFVYKCLVLLTMVGNTVI